MPFYIYDRLDELQFFKDIASELDLKFILFHPQQKTIEAWKE